MEHLKQVNSKIVSRKELQRASMMIAEKDIKEIFQLSDKEYGEILFELGCEFADDIHPDVKQSKVFWEWWSFFTSLHNTALRNVMKKKQIDRSNKDVFIELLNEESLMKDNRNSCLSYINDPRNNE